MRVPRILRRHADPPPKSLTARLAVVAAGDLKGGELALAAAKAAHAKAVAEAAAAKVDLAKARRDLSIVQETGTANPGAAAVVTVHPQPIPLGVAAAIRDAQQATSTADARDAAGRVRYAPRIEVWKGVDGRWYGHRRASNGKITDPTQGYSRRRGVLAWANRTFPDLAVIDRPPKP